MTKNLRVIYFVLVISIILIGLLSRRMPLIPSFVGDVLWATMIFFIVRILFVHIDVRLNAFISLSACYLVEFSQLYQADWINQVRQTTMGRLVLGQGFLWSDLIAYAVGILIGLLIEKMIVRRIV
ncbi:DUF2809 domain-containing protein [Desertivirga arenae]|uniref:ribosomal maturation YjgA family protein n=1 Tax=Desertivirga arenae TaxID=2810309 RepID=UPI001A95F179